MADRKPQSAFLGYINDEYQSPAGVLA